MNKSTLVIALAAAIVLLESHTCSAAIRDKRISDEEIARLIIGSWVTAPSDPTFEEPGAISTYHENGNLTFHSYKDQSCTELNFVTKANWSIHNGLLLISVTESEREDMHPPGFQVVDEVRDINLKYKVLTSISSGTVQYRVRSQRCIHKNEI